MCAKISDDHFYSTTDPKSPRIIRLADFLFYSLPPSPTSTGILMPQFNPATKPPTPKTYRDDGSIGDDQFEFKTSQPFKMDDSSYETPDIRPRDEKVVHPRQDLRRRSESERMTWLPSMSYHDAEEELFCDGRAAPLKPPPRFQYTSFDSRKLSHHGSATVPPKLPSSMLPSSLLPSSLLPSSMLPSSMLPSSVLPGSVLKMPFQRQSLWNDDFDPFVAALENVKEERKEKHEVLGHRRAWSMLPLGGCTALELDDYFANEEWLGSSKRTEPPLPNPAKKKEASQEKVEEHMEPIKLSEPKGVVFARRARLVKMDPEWPKKKMTKNLQDSMKKMVTNPQESRIVGGGGESNGKESSSFKIGKVSKSKRHKVKKFLLSSGASLRSVSLGSISFRKTFDEEQPKQADQNVEILKPKITTQSCFLSHKSGKSNEVKGQSQVNNKMAIVKHSKPKLLLCMGSFGANFQ